MDIFSKKNKTEFEKLILGVYKKDKNYSIVKTKNKSKIAVVYFSSNAFFKKNEQSFYEKLKYQDRYEFKKRRIKSGEKHIFLRDIFLNWYFLGINEKINTIDKIFEFLKKETKGYKVITMGLSGGGYMAMLMGSLLKASYAFSLSGQIDTLAFMGGPDSEFPYCDKNSKHIKKYLNIEKIIRENPIDIFNFVAKDFPQDKENIELSKKIPNIRTFVMDTYSHHAPLTEKYLSYYMNMSKEELISMYSKINNQIITPKKLDALVIPTVQKIKIRLIRFFSKPIITIKVIGDYKITHFIKIPIKKKKIK